MAGSPRSMQTYARIVRFIIAGSLATGTNIASLYALIHFVHLPYLLASVAAFLCGFVVSFTLQKFWTFRNKETNIIGQQALSYFLIVLANLSLNTLVVYALVEHAGVNPIIAQALASLLIALESFFAYRFLVFDTPRQFHLRNAPKKDAADIALSVIVLCYRAGEEVRRIVPAIKSLLEGRGLRFELVLVGNYDASSAQTDSTPRIIRELADADPTIVPVTLEKRGMFGWDVKSGLERARGERVLYIDGDGQNPFIDILRVYDALLEAGADMAQTYRVERHDGAERILVSRLYNLILRIIFPRVYIYDGNSKPKIFTRSALEALRLTSDNWFIDAEIVIQACYKGFIVAQVPTIFNRNAHRSSFVNIAAVGRFFLDLIRYRLSANAPWRRT